MQAAIGNISRGQIFIPFHFGYFDSKDERARAANELTLERWDSVSKQPCFKAGAVQITKCQEDWRERPTVFVKSEQVRYEQKAAKNKPDADEVGDTAAREKHIALWLGATVEALDVLSDTYTQLVPNLIHDLEVQYGLRVLGQITVQAVNVLRPHCRRYHTRGRYGHEISEHLRNSLFPAGTPHIARTKL
jgi:hypothetical protein